MPCPALINTPESHSQTKRTQPYLRRIVFRLLLNQRFVDRRMHLVVCCRSSCFPARRHCRRYTRMSGSGREVFRICLDEFSIRFMCSSHLSSTRCSLLYRFQPFPLYFTTVSLFCYLSVKRWGIVVVVFICKSFYSILFHVRRTLFLKVVHHNGSMFSCVVHCLRSPQNSSVFVIVAVVVGLLSLYSLQRDYKSLYLAVLLTRSRSISAMLFYVARRIF